MSVDQLLSAAQRYLQGNQLQEAEQACTEALALAPEHPQGLLLAAAIAARAEQLPRAEELLQRVLRLDPGEVQALYLLGGVHRKAGELAKATACLIRALRIEFNLPECDDEMQFWQLLVDGIAGKAPVEHCLWRADEFCALGATLETRGVLRQHRNTVRKRIAAVDLLSLPDGEIAYRLIPLLGLMGFSKQSDAAWNRMLFESAMLPWMSRSLNGGRHDIALLLEASVLAEYVAQTETEEHFGACLRRWAGAMRSAGRRFASGLAALPKSNAAERPKVAFFVHRLSRLAHARLMLDVLEGHAQLDRPLIAPLIVCLRKSSNPEIVERVRRLGVELIELWPPGVEMIRSKDLLALRAALAERGIEALVWVSVVESLPFAFGMRVAPAQIWWAMKYHDLELPEIDGHLTAGSFFGGTRRIGARDWRAGPVASEDWFAPELAGEASRLRSEYARHRIVYGCFGREDKLNSDPFLEAVATILKAVPDAGFLWTGRQRDRAIQARLEAAGIAERCHFIGWVNTRLYAQVIDVFLDSFPFPCGYTLYESLAAAKPAVLYASAEAADMGARSMIEPLLYGDQVEAEDREAARSIFGGDSGDSLYLCAQSPAEYASCAIRLAGDDALRRSAGEAGRRFVARFMSDRKRLGRIYCEHIAAIVHEARARRTGLYRDNPKLRG